MASAHGPVAETTASSALTAAAPSTANPAARPSASGPGEGETDAPTGLQRRPPGRAFEASSPAVRSGRDRGHDAMPVHRARRAARLPRGPGASRALSRSSVPCGPMSPAGRPDRVTCARRSMSLAPCAEAVSAHEHAAAKRGRPPPARPPVLSWLLGGELVAEVEPVEVRLAASSVEVDRAGGLLVGGEGVAVQL